MNWRLPQWGERWLSNLALFFGLTVVCGLVVGVLAAVFGSGTIEGQSSTINYYDNDGSLLSVDTPDDDPAPGMLVLMPLLIVAGSIFFALPFAIAWLGIGELACVLGAPAKIVRRVGLGLAALVALLVLSGQGGSLYVFFVVGMVAFVALCRLPPGRVAADT